jgi:histidinol-phosphatase (PHP family)
MGISDLHMHTCASWDCSAEMRDMCEQAVRLGLEAVAFTEHVELNPDDDHTYSTFDYHKAREIWEKVRDEFRGRLVVLFGAEVSYWPHLEAEIRRYVEERPFDLVIGSIHHAPVIDFWKPRNAETVRSDPDRAREALKSYFADTEKLASSGLFDVVGHFGVYERYMPGAWPEIWGDEELETLLTSAVQAIAQNSRLELNAQMLHKPGHLPAPRVEVLKLYREMGGARPVFGSDAHMVAKVGANLHLALEAIREAGFDRFAPWTGVIRKNGPSYKAAQRIDMG